MQDVQQHSYRASLSLYDVLSLLDVRRRQPQKLALVTTVSFHGLGSVYSSISDIFTGTVLDHIRRI